MLLAMSTGLYAALGVVYLILLVWIGFACLRKGHWIMFIVGIFLPIFWIIGAVIPPSDSQIHA